VTEADESSLPMGGDRERSSDEGDPRGLWNRFHRPLLIVGMRHLGSRADAEDMAQETLHRVTKALDENRVREMQALPGFVLQTARHICQQWLRKRGREHRALQGYGQESDEASDAVQPLTDLIDEERRKVVRRALQSLPAEDQHLLEHLYALDTDPHELAERLRITPGALRVRKHRILKRLAASLGDCGAATNSALREL
jgi:RNA polymerase sigma factor (sigma-70 family)